MRLKNRAIKLFMSGMLGVSAALARRPVLWPLARAWSHALASLTVRSRRIRPQVDLHQLGAQWQRSFPSARQVPITGIDASTVHAEIHTPCPLRGSGDVQACYRMMEYDRAVLRAAGGEFVVLHSQAEPGRQHCEVAMRLRGAPLDDLKPAHRR